MKAPPGRPGAETPPTDRSRRGDSICEVLVAPRGPEMPLNAQFRRLRRAKTPSSFPFPFLHLSSPPTLALFFDPSWPTPACPSHIDNPSTTQTSKCTHHEPQPHPKKWAQTRTKKWGRTLLKKWTQIRPQKFVRKKVESTLPHNVGPGGVVMWRTKPGKARKVGPLLFTRCS